MQECSRSFLVERSLKDIRQSLIAILPIRPQHVPGLEYIEGRRESPGNGARDGSTSGGRQGTAAVSFKEGVAAPYLALFVL